MRPDRPCQQPLNHRAGGSVAIKAAACAGRIIPPQDNPAHEQYLSQDRRRARGPAGGHVLGAVLRRLDVLSRYSRGAHLRIRRPRGQGRRRRQPAPAAGALSELRERARRRRRWPLWRADAEGGILQGLARGWTVADRHPRGLLYRAAEARVPCPPRRRCEPHVATASGEDATQGDRAAHLAEVDPHHRRQPSARARQRPRGDAAREDRWRGQCRGSGRPVRFPRFVPYAPDRSRPDAVDGQARDRQRTAAQGCRQARRVGLLVCLRRTA